MIKTIKDIINFVESWHEKYGALIEDEQIANFIGELQRQLSEMDFSITYGTTVIIYAGDSNDVKTWRISEQISKALGDNERYVCVGAEIF